MSKQRTHGGIRRLVSGLLCLVLVFGLLPTGIILPAAAHWADPYGQKLVEWGVMRGDISGNLNLGRPITRAELVTMINRAYGYTRKAGTPFTDVPSSKWYADDIDIAYNAGYFKGVSNTQASPETNVTREQAAVFLARNLMLQETVGETLGFSDSRVLSEWSRGLIGAAVQEGVLNGYSDGSFKPRSNITRGELAAMLVRAIGTPVNQAGDHTLGHVYGNVTLNTSNVNLRDTTIAGNLYLTGGIDLGHVVLENVTVLGRIVISGAGEAIEGQESIVLRNVEAEELVVDSLKTHTVTVRAQGVTDIPLTTVRANAFINDASWEGYGLSRLELRGDPGTKFQLAGSIKEVMNFTPASDLQFVKGSAEKVTVDEDAIASTVLVDKNTRVDELNLDVATKVTGPGDIKNLNVGSAGSEVEQLPDQIVIRPGITADIDGTTMGSTDAAEMSAEPRLLAGYPYMKNVAPTVADGVFSGSKPGTIYWAISAVSDGSVSEEDLIENPAYGGNIFQEQAGSIAASSAHTEYIGKVQNLEPDGSYYVSAILVDGQGKRSHLKVAAFTTPDDTKPDFNDKKEQPNTNGKYAYMSKITTDVAQATVMANKDCLLYWALLPDGAKAPTPQEFKSGSLGGNYGSGSLSVVKNAEISITVNRRKLQEKTPYVLFLWLTDHNGAQSMDQPLEIKFSTPDETPPLVISPTQMPPYGADFANVVFSMNEAPATLFWAVVPAGDTSFIVPGDNDEETAEIMADLRTKIKVEGAGDSVLASGSSAVSGAYTNTTFRVTGLDTAKTNTNNYWLYYVGKDAAGNYSDRVVRMDIKTLDTKPPEVELKFTDAVEGKPRASSSIQFVFSETVKGGAREGGKTFLDFYQDVVSAQGNPENLEAAKNALSEELAKHIRMYSVPRNGQPVPLQPRYDPATGNVEPTNWTVDFRNATVELVNGQMIITLPNDEDPEKSALKLESGATYYFQLLGVYDNAFIPNGILDPDTNRPDPNGNLRLDNFTTIYGQVELARNTSTIKITQPDSATADEKKLNGIRLDMCVDVKPESTSKMPDTEYWDLIMWSNLGIDIQVYFQKGNDPWVLLNENADIRMNAGLGLGTRSEVTNTTAHRIQPVVDSLKEDTTYRYGIHITRVGNIKETDNQAEPQDWNELVTMRFSIVAGSQGDIQNLSRSVDQNYDKFVNTDQTVTEIGIEYMQTGTRRILEYPKQFTDTRVPEFSSGMPTFNPGSGTIVMEAGLQRPGRIYWVAAPVGTIVTSVKDGTPVNSSNDGTKDDTVTPPITPPTTYPDKTYVPISGDDRENKKGDIHFMTGSNGGPAEYSAPYYRDIINGKKVYENNQYVKTGVLELGGAVEYESITGLIPETWYYIYIVREGGGEPNNIVEIYRVKTKKVQAPTVDMRPSGTTGVTMTPSDTSSILYYALVEWNSLPTWFLEEYEWKEGGGKYQPQNPPATKGPEVMTVLEAMITRTRDGSGKTYFDVYGAEPNINLKDRVMDYITSPTNDQVGYIPIVRENTEDDTKTREFSAEEMKSQTSEYVVLACARNLYGADVGSSYGFAASRGLYRPDPEPPEFNGRMPLTECSISGVKDSVGTAKPDWRYDKAAPSYKFTGKVTISFNKLVYYATTVNGNRVRLQVVNKEDVDDEATQISILDVITGTGKSKFSIASGDEKDGPTDSFTLTFTDLEYGEAIQMQSIGNSNNQSETSRKTLRMSFDSTLTNADWGGLLDNMLVPGFRVTWQ